MSDLFWLTDAQMARLEPFFPKSHGKPRVDDRRVLSGIIFINRNGLRWRDAPAAYGPQDVLCQKPTGGAVFAFRGRRGDRIKLLYWDGQGFCLYYKVLERGRFPWPSAKVGSARLTSAQLAMLWEGIDWRRPDWGAPPARVG